MAVYEKIVLACDHCDARQDAAATRIYRSGSLYSFWEFATWDDRAVGWTVNGEEYATTFGEEAKVLCPACIKKQKENPQWE